MELKEKIEGYRDVTLELIRTLEKEEFDLLQQLLDKRQAFIEEMDTLSYTKEEFKEICDNFHILKLQEKLDTLMKEKQRETKEKLNKIIQEKTANNAYNSNFYTQNKFLNKKI